MQDNAGQSRTVQDSAGQRRTIQDNAGQRRTMQDNAVRPAHHVILNEVKDLIHKSMQKDPKEKHTSNVRPS